MGIIQLIQRYPIINKNTIALCDLFLLTGMYQSAVFIVQRWQKIKLFY